MGDLNPNCDGSQCRGPGEVRVLPLSKGGDSNLIVCRACYENEMRVRRDRNKSLGEWARFEIPDWEALKPYQET